LEFWDLIKPLQGLRVNPSRVFGGTGRARDGAEPHMFGIWILRFGISSEKRKSFLSVKWVVATFDVIYISVPLPVMGSNRIITGDEVELMKEWPRT
jgi:hypothetical protein